MSSQDFCPDDIAAALLTGLRSGSWVECDFTTIHARISEAILAAYTLGGQAALSGRGDGGEVVTVDGVRGMAHYPTECPITGRPFFMVLRDGERLIPTYGGPFDSYTIPVRDDDGGLFVRRYDHDEGGWVDGSEALCLYVVKESDLPDRADPIAWGILGSTGLVGECGMTWPTEAEASDTLDEWRRASATLTKHYRVVPLYAESPRAGAVAWSKEAPTVPGWYWMRERGGEPEAVKVGLYSGRMALFVHGPNEGVSCEAMRAEWSPLSAPLAESGR